MTTKPQGKPLKPPTRNEKGQITGGAVNPGGMTKESRRKRDLLREWLETDEVTDEWRRAYLAEIKNGNTAILIDAGNRLLGKPKEHIEHSTDSDRPLMGVSAEAILEALAKRKA